MSFGNKIVNTQSPGGKRRGLIWVSGDGTGPRPESCNFVVSPFTISGASFSKSAGTNDNIFSDPDIKTMTFPGKGMQIDVEGNTVFCACSGIKPVFGVITPLINPGFPYVTQIKQKDGQNYLATLADLVYYEAEVDMYIYPKTFREKTSVTPYGSSEITYTPPSQYYSSGHQLNQDASIGGKMYYQRSPGNSQSNREELQHERFITPSIPMRIKGKLLFADYPYAINSLEVNSRAEALASIIDYEHITQLISSRLASYSYPSDDEFEGASITSPQRGDFYQLNGVPLFQPASGVRYDTPASNTASIQHWRMTKNVVYNGLNNDYQFFFSPIQYPHSIWQGTDQWCGLYGITTSYPEEFLKHDDPMFMSPLVFYPRAGWVNYTYPVTFYSSKTGRTTTVVSNQRLHPHIKPLEFNPGTFTHSYLSSYWNSSSSPLNPDITSTYGDSMLQPGGLSVGSSFVDCMSILFNISADVAHNYQNESIVQPKFTKGTKYIQEVSPEVAMHTFHILSQDYACSGRYKYCGFKGKISFFELP